jgi:WD40 repeat protein
MIPQDLIFPLTVSIFAGFVYVSISFCMDRNASKPRPIQAIKGAAIGLAVGNLILSFAFSIPCNAGFWCAIGVFANLYENLSASISGAILGSIFRYLVPRKIKWSVAFAGIGAITSLIIALVLPALNSPSVITLSPQNSSELGATRVIQNAHRGYTTSTAISSDGKTLVSGGSDSIVRTWQLSTGSLIRTFSGHRSQVTNVAISPNGQILVSANLDGDLKIWQLETGKLIREFAQVPANRSSRRTGIYLVFSPDGRSLVSADPNGTINVRNPENGELLNSFKTKSNFFYRGGVRIAVDNETLVAFEAQDIIRLWNFKTGKLLREIPIQGEIIDIDRNGKKVAIRARSQGGERIAIVKILDLDTNKTITQISFAFERNGLWDSIPRGALSPDGQIFVTLHARQIEIWLVKSGKLLATAQVSTSYLESNLIISSDKRTMISSGDQYGYPGSKEIYLWQLPALQAI